jgi:5'/3'-nucleotidase SurE
VLTLLTNDDGIFAPGLAAMERALGRLGDVVAVAPSTEQSGVGHAITFLTPLTAKQVFDGARLRGWAVDGSPADAVKLEIQRCIDSTSNFVAIVSFDEGSSPSSLAAAITFLSCSIAALNQHDYVSFARKAAARKANQRKRSMRTTLLPLL